MHYVFEPGLWSSSPVRVAVLVGTVVAITSAVVGVFTVTRGQSFAGHSLADVATTGGSGAFLVGLNQFWGFLAFGVAAAVMLEVIGVQRRRGRDVTTGVVLGAGLGLAALFLYLGTQQSNTTGASFTVLFGSIFVIQSSTIPALIASGVIALIVIVALSRVLLLSSLSPDVAAARGVPVRAVGVAYLVALAISVSLSSVAIGAVLSTALLIGPAATALRIAKSPVRAMITAALIGVVVTWLGTLLAYDSYYWPPHGHAWPVSFFIVALVVLAYLLTYLRRPARPPAPAPPAAGAGRRPSAARVPAGPGPSWRSAPSHVQRLHDEHLDRGQHRRGHRRRRRLLRGAARLDLRRPRHPQRRLRGRGRGQPDRGQHPGRPGRVLGRGRARHRRVRPQGPARRGHRADPGPHAGDRGPVHQPGRPVRPGDLLAAVRRGLRHQSRRPGPDRRPRRAERGGAAGDLPPADADLGHARGRRRPRRQPAPGRDDLPPGHGPGHQHDGPGGRRPADVLPDDRPGRRGAFVHRPALAGRGPVRGLRPWPRLGRHRRVLRNELAARLLRRRPRRRLLPVRPRLGLRPPHLGRPLGPRPFGPRPRPRQRLTRPVPTPHVSGVTAATPGSLGPGEGGMEG